MPDREKIESLKQCLSASCRGFRTCPYSDTEWDAIKTVLELLAEQEPVEPDKILTNPVCGVCDEPLDVTDNYCRHCGRKVKWKNGC